MMTVMIMTMKMVLAGMDICSVSHFLGYYDDDADDAHNDHVDNDVNDDVDDDVNDDVNDHVDDDVDDDVNDDVNDDDDTCKTSPPPDPHC